jgi:hypothetical protein
MLAGDDVTHAIRDALPDRCLSTEIHTRRAQALSACAALTTTLAALTAPSTAVGTHAGASHHLADPIAFAVRIDSAAITPIITRQQGQARANEHP